PCHDYSLWIVVPFGLELLLQTREVVHRTVDTLGIARVGRAQQRPGFGGETRCIPWRSRLAEPAKRARENAGQGIYGGWIRRSCAGHRVRDGRGRFRRGCRRSG